MGINRFLFNISIPPAIHTSKTFYSTQSKNIRIISYQDNVYPRSVKKFFPAKSRTTNNIPDKIIEPKQTPVNKEQRVNEVNMQMLSKNIYDQVFKSYNQTNKPSDDTIDCCLHDLSFHGMKTQEVDYMPDVKLKIPEFEGKNLEEHFQIIGEQQSGPYKKLVLELLQSIPSPPKQWIFQSGWTRYTPNSPPESVPFPSEDAYVFDVEVTVNYGPVPTLATAVSNKAWYGWISPSLINATDKPLTGQHYTLNDFIPLESDANQKSYNLSPDSKKPKVVIGHNVSYDRSKIREQYWFEQTGMRFVDTMSLHVCINGITSYQRAILKSGKEDDQDEKSKIQSSLNSLYEVHKLYCGSEIDKQTRDIFMEGNLLEVKEKFQEVMQYCASDVIATYNVMKKIFPIFLERFPHPVTFSGMLEMGMAYLPVNQNWNRYISDCQQTYEDLEIEGKFLLARRADQACQLMHDEKFREDLWMWDQDWTTQELKMKKTIPKAPKNTSETVESVSKQENEEDEEFNKLEEKFKPLINTKNMLPAKKPLLPGYPTWYRKLCTKPTEPNWIPGPHTISTSMQVTPKLLRLTWEGFPLHYIREKGWGFLVPHSEDWDG